MSEKAGTGRMMTLVRRGSLGTVKVDIFGSAERNRVGSSVTAVEDLQAADWKRLTKREKKEMGWVIRERSGIGGRA